MACMTGVPDVPAGRADLALQLVLAMNSAAALLSPLSTAIMNFTSLWPAYHEEILSYSGEPSVADVPTSTKSTPAFSKTGFAPSIRGWMLPVPGVAMMPATRSPLLTCCRICVRDRRSGRQVVLADVGLPVVDEAGRDVGVVGDDRDAGVERRSVTAC